METGQDLFDHYTNSGFSFDPDLLSRYALSLHSKPFVILSGISGTGKTKIAQLFPMEQLQKKSKITQKPAPAKQDLGRISIWFNDGSCVRLRPQHKGHVWSYDFVADRTHDGRAFRMLTVIDEYTPAPIVVMTTPTWPMRIELGDMKS